MIVTKELAEAFTKWQKGVTQKVDNLEDRVSLLEDLLIEQDDSDFEIHREQELLSKK